MTKNFTLLYIFNNQKQEKDMLIQPALFFENIEKKLRKTMPEIEVPEVLNDKLRKILYR
jgi:hypothetical protein